MRERVRHMDGTLNVSPADRQANIRHAIRLGLPQVRGHQLNDQEICLVGSGPSLAQTIEDVRALQQDGASVIAMNGSYAWLLEHGVTPNAMVMIDARPFNARFLTPIVPSCTYFLASQCAPEVFAAVRSHPKVYLWHGLTGDDPEEKALLDQYYLGAWQSIAGGCTIGTRAIVLLRVLGFHRLHLFGMDSCYLHGDGHALAQPENDQDGVQDVTCGGRIFQCSAWMAEQALEFMDLIATNGEHFELAVHGDGLLAHIVRVGATASDDLLAHWNAAPVAAKGV